MDELRLIRHIWLDEKHEFEDLLPQIYEEETGKVQDGLGDDEKTCAKYFRLHLNRGINHYSARDVLKSCQDLLRSAGPKEES